MKASVHRLIGWGWLTYIHHLGNGIRRLLGKSMSKCLSYCLHQLNYYFIACVSFVIHTPCSQWGVYILQHNWFVFVFYMYGCCILPPPRVCVFVYVWRLGIYFRETITNIVYLFVFFFLQVMEEQMLEEMERKRVEQLEEEKRKKVRKKPNTNFVIVNTLLLYVWERGTLVLELLIAGVPVGSLLSVCVYKRLTIPGRRKWMNVHNYHYCGISTEYVLSLVAFHSLSPWPQHNTPTNEAIVFWLQSQPPTIVLNLQLWELHTCICCHGYYLSLGAYHLIWSHSPNHS